MGLTRRQLGETLDKKMVEELRKRLGESLKVKTSKSEDLRLTYFPARGRAEISRLILAHAGVKFDDIRLTGEDFAKVKPLLPYGSMPILEYKGEVTVSRWPSPSSWLSSPTSGAPPPSTRRRPTRSCSPSTESLKASPSVFLPRRVRELA